ISVGPVFLLLSAQAPLLQRWFAAARDAGNPYSLYAASNLGSFAGLLAYPLWLEPNMSLGQQSGFWTTGYVVLIALLALAGLSRRHGEAPAATETELRSAETPAEPVSAKRVLLWLALTAVPSGLML